METSFRSALRQTQLPTLSQKHWHQHPTVSNGCQMYHLLWRKICTCLVSPVNPMAHSYPRHCSLVPSRSSHCPWKFYAVEPMVRKIGHRNFLACHMVEFHDCLLCHKLLTYRVYHCAMDYHNLKSVRFFIKILMKCCYSLRLCIIETSLLLRKLVDTLC